MSKELATALKLPIVGQAYLRITGLLAKNNPQNYDLVRPIVQLGRFKQRMTTVVVPDLDTKLTIKGYKETAEFLKTKDIKLADNNIISDTVGPIPLIIGADYFAKFVSRIITKYDVQMLNTAGGKLLIGSLPCKGVYSVTEVADPVFVTPLQSILVARIGAQITPNEIPDIIDEGNIPIHKIWDLDTVGINPEAPNIEDQMTQNYYDSTVEYKDNQYWVRLPWKINAPPLPSNYNNARGQLMHMWSKLRKMKLCYNNMIK